MADTKEVHGRLTISAYQHLCRVMDENGIATINAALNFVILRDKREQNGTKVGRDYLQ